MKVCVFPGQGSQYIGMGKDLYDSFSVAKDVFEEVDDALNFKLSNVIFNGKPTEKPQMVSCVNLVNHPRFVVPANRHSSGFVRNGCRNPFQPMKHGKLRFSDYLTGNEDVTFLSCAAGHRYGKVVITDGQRKQQIAQ